MLAYWWVIWTLDGNGHLTATAPSGGTALVLNESFLTWRESRRPGHTEAILVIKWLASD